MKIQDLKIKEVIIKKNVYQIITACSDGAIAALSAKKYVSKH